MDLRWKLVGERKKTHVKKRETRPNISTLRGRMKEKKSDISYQTRI